MNSSPKKLPEVLTREEAEKILAQPNKNCPTGLRNRCILQIMYRCGLRVSEVRNLAPKDIDFSEGILRVWRGKGAVDRTLYVDEHTLDLLRLWKEQRPNNSRFFFCTLQGKRIKSSYIRQFVYRYRDRAGIQKNVHPHTFRHTFATELLQEGANIRQVQKALGHSNLSSTMIYTHVWDGELAERLRNRPKISV